MDYKGVVHWLCALYLQDELCSTHCPLLQAERSTVVGPGGALLQQAPQNHLEHFVRLET